MAGISWRFVALLAVLAMIFSLFMSGLAGVPLSLIIMRAVISGLSLAVLAIIVNSVFFRFFPEMYSDTSDFIEEEASEKPHENLSETGRRINMVTPDEPINLYATHQPSDEKIESPPVAESGTNYENKADYETSAIAQVIRTVMNRD